MPRADEVESPSRSGSSLAWIQLDHREVINFN